MKPQITTKQLLAVRQLLSNLKEFSDKKYGSIRELMIMTNKMLPNTILVKYEKNFVTAGAQDYEFRIAAIGQDGEILFLDDKFKDLFERASFLAECKLFEIEDANEYEKID
jgi:hypothetical protein